MPDHLPYRPATDPITLRLDRWASMLRNFTNDDGTGELTLTDDERIDLSTLLTQAANQVRS